MTRTRISVRLIPVKRALDPGASRKAKPRFSPWQLGGLSVKELLKRVWKSANEDDIFGRSAQLAYYFFLALFPALIFLTATLGLLAASGKRLHDTLLEYMTIALPGPVYDLVKSTLEQTTAASGGGKLTFGLLAGLWTASSGMAAVQDTLNGVYKVRDTRPIWKARGIATVLTIASGILLIVALAVTLYGDTLVDYIGVVAGLGPIATLTLKIVQGAVALFFLSLVFSVTYYYAPDLKGRPWQWLTPGAVVGMFTWIVASGVLRVYLHYFNSYSATYGSLGAVIVLLTWFYVSGMMLLLGAEVNAEIEGAIIQRQVTA